MAEIATLTMNPAIDESASVDYVVSETKLRCSPARYDAGGGGINVARAATRLGGQALAIYVAGGPAGELLGERLDSEGVPRLALPIAGWTRRNLNVRETATGRQYRFVFPGPPLDEADGARVLETLEALSPRPAFLIASGSLPPGAPADLYGAVAEIARRRGMRFLLDSSGEPLSQALRKGVFLVKPSLREFGQLVGEAATEEPELTREARRLIARGACEVVVLSLGGGGALWVTHEESGRILAPAVPVASSVGAGDTLVAGIAVSLVRGHPLRDAVRFGVAAAAATCMNAGTQLCRLEDAERLYNAMQPAP
jgi:6-phosphofructokinase 2